MRILTILVAAALVLTGCAASETQLEKKAARIHAAAYTVDSHNDPRESHSGNLTRVFSEVEAAAI